MRKSKLTPSHVAHARRRAARGEPITHIAQDLNVPYPYLHSAVRGRTFAWLKNPPPVPNGSRAKAIYTCQNPHCGRQFQSGHSRNLCQRCDTYHRRHGRHRPADTTKGKRIPISNHELLTLHQRYQAGESTETLADGRPYSAETLRRRFHQANFPINVPGAGPKQQLTAPLVRQLRRRHYEEGQKIYRLAQEVQINYMTVYSAVRGQTWRSAGGPLPQTAEELQECQRCGILSHQTYCRFCRQEKGRGIDPPEQTS